jgi:hypothetical protein
VPLLDRVPALPANIRLGANPKKLIY